MPVEVLGTWPTIAGTGEEGGQWKKKEGSIVEDELSKLLTMQII